MRRPMSLAAFALFLAVPVWAQHGGGHGSGGHAGGGFSGHAGFSGGGSHISGGMQSGAGHSTPGASRGFANAPSTSQRSFSRPPFNNGGFHGTFHGTRNHNLGFRSNLNCFGRGCRAPYFYPYAWGYYDPYWWSDSGSSDYYDNDYESNLAQADQMNQESLAQQAQEVAEEEQMRRQEEDDGDQDIYARPPARPHSRLNMSDETPGQEILPATVLVFRDQHQQEIRNYAIVGQTLWSFGSPRTEKIPLADLDLPATVKA